MLKLENVNLTIKMHPREKYYYLYKKIIESTNKNIEIIKDGMNKDQLYGLIAKSDVVVSFFSSVLLETSLLNKPVIFIKLNNPRKVDSIGTFYSETPAIIKTEPEENLNPIIKKILYDKNFHNKLTKERKIMIDDFFYKLNGKEAQRCIKEIKYLIKKYEK